MCVSVSIWVLAPMPKSVCVCLFGCVHLWRCMYMYESYSSLQLGGSSFRFLSRRVMYFRQTDLYRTAYDLTQPRQSVQEEGALDEGLS